MQHERRRKPVEALTIRSILGALLVFVLNFACFSSARGESFQVEIQDAVVTRVIKTATPSLPQENESRKAHLAILERLHFRDLPAKWLPYFKTFALSEAGAEWLSRVVAYDAELLLTGVLEAAPGLSDGIYPIERVLTDHVSFDVLLNRPFSLFEITSHDGFGAFASPNMISLGRKGVRDLFEGSCESVDPIAILAHEFGHTRFGLPSSGGSLEGERAVVLKFENPVRVQDGFLPRETYYDSGSDQTIFILSGEVRAGRWRVEKGLWRKAYPNEPCKITE
jgi:hypothetical protein